MDFRTAIKIDSLSEPIRHSDKLMLIGSCFSTNIGSRFTDAMIDALVNPLGTLYNPMSIATAVERIAGCRLVEPNELFLANGVWNSFDFHSSFSAADHDVALQRMNEAITAAHSHLRECSYVFLTLGTAITYSHSGKVVGNCHKLPAAQFERSMRSVGEVTEALQSALCSLRSVNQGVKVVFTVSPIRHIADGLAANSLSKSTLRVAVGEIVATQPDCHYFPSYEIMLDDLRDYRFYASDMVHPSEVAVEYIWQQLLASCIDPADLPLIDRCERMTKRLRHRPMSDNAELVARFRADTEAALARLIAEQPHIAAVLHRSTE